VMGRVQLALRFDPDGRAAEVAVVKSMLYDSNVRHDAAALRSLRQFERAALDAARTWRVKVAPGGAQSEVPHDFTAMTAEVFTLVKTDLAADGQWLPVKRLPDRLSPNPKGPYYDKALLERGIGIRFNGQEKTNVWEYCVSEGWVRVVAGVALDRKGNPMTMLLKGTVEPYFDAPQA